MILNTAPKHFKVYHPARAGPRTKENKEKGPEIFN